MNSTAPLVIFLHGAGTAKAMWTPQLEGLHDVRTLAIDLPGHGTLLGSPFTLDAAAVEVDKAVATADGAPVVLVGLSMGGYVAMDYIARHPERISAAVVSGSAIDYSRGRFPYLVKLTRLMLKIYPKSVLGKMNAKTTQKLYPKYAQQLNAVPFSWDGFGQALGQFTGSYFPARMTRFTVPLLIVHGAKDKRNRQEEQRLLDTLPTSTLRVLPTAGHMCNLDDPDGFNDAVLDFVAAIAATVPSAGTIRGKTDVNCRSREVCDPHDRSSEQ